MTIRPSRWTLRRRLVVGVVALLSTVLVASGVLGILTLSSTVTRAADGQVTSAMSALQYMADKFTLTGEETFKKPMVEFVGQAPDSMIAYVVDGTVIDSASFAPGDPAVVPDDVAALLAQLDTGGRTQTLTLGELGVYRVLTEPYHDGRLIAGVSMDAFNDLVVREAVVQLIAAIAAILIAGIGTVLVVRRALRPLDEVVETAREVTRIPLDHGEVSIRQRVTVPGAEPRTEVGQVGHALDTLLEHVDDALAVRTATDRRMRRFLTDVSHELRTPLAAIRGYAELTRQDSDTLPQVTEYALQRIEAESNRMSSLVADLLLLARLDEGQDLHVDPVDLGELVDDAVNDARAAAPEHHWSADVRTDALVLADSERMRQVLVNILSNAAIHTPRGSSIVVSVDAVDTTGPEPQSWLELRIQDDGPGIDPELLPDLFRRFTRADNDESAARGSTGLGLAIVASIVDAHRGTVDVASGAGGTTFTVRLPRQAAARPAVTSSIA